MARPYVVEEKIFDGADATETKSLKFEFAICSTKVVEIITTGFSGTVDIKGSVDQNATKDNVTYAQLGQGAALSQANAQLPFTTSTARARYVVVEPYPYMEIVMTRTAGSVDISVFGYGAMGLSLS